MANKVKKTPERGIRGPFLLRVGKPDYVELTQKCPSTWGFAMSIG
jgi:hypothetical protein